MTTFSNLEELEEWLTKPDMTNQQFLEGMQEFFKELYERTKEKQEEYTVGDNPFHNFEQAESLSTTDSRERVAWEYCVKHLQSIKDVISDDTIEYGPEWVDEKIGDVIVYFVLIRAMLKEFPKND
jgi:hypothetical protein